MSVLKKGLLGLIVAHFAAFSSIAWTQTSQPLPKRIAKADPTRYRAVQDGKDWKNPYLVVRPNGIELVGTTPPGSVIPVEKVKEVLEGLPTSSWPYGLVVAVQDIGLISDGDLPRIQATRQRLLRLLKELGITADPWPSA